ncbi:MAG: TolB family protein [Planctomycetota bacterium]
MSVQRCLVVGLFALVAIGPMAQGEEPVGKKTGIDAHPQEQSVLSNIRQLTFESMGLTNAGEGYFSPDGRTIIFQATPVGKEDYQIYTMDLVGGEPKMVSTGKGACTCSYFRPDGKKIIFASSHLDPNLGKPTKEQTDDEYEWKFDKHMDIFEADPDGSHLKRLTDTSGYDAEGTYSADGSKIVFTSERDGDLEIYIMDADGQNPRRVTYGKGYDGGPFFSPDMKMILYRGDRRNDGHMNLQIRMVDANGKNDRALTDNPIFNWCPSWHPDGEVFIFTQADHRGRPNYDLYMMDRAGRRLTRITHDMNFDGLPVFSPDGKRLMWTSKRNGVSDSQLFIADFTLPAALQ